MKILLFGATGSAGGSVLLVCLSTPSIEEVRVIVRRPLTVAHAKLRVFIHDDFLDYSAVEEAFTGVDTCFYCLGISATQVSGEEEYRRITHDFALAAAQTLELHSPDATFHFISGQGANLNSSMMWARVKAETEQDLLKLVQAVCWRPAFIDGEYSQSAPRIYQWLRPLFRVFMPFPSLYVAGEDLGYAMIQVAADRLIDRIVENAEIRRWASFYRKHTDREEWLVPQIHRLESLRGQQVIGWQGVEMALGEAESGEPQIWEHESVPLLQISVLRIVLGTGVFVMTTTQENINFGLFCPPEDTSPSWEPEPDSIFRVREFRELPVGVIDRVSVSRWPGLIASVELLVGGRQVSLRAGEVYEEMDGSFRVVYLDESILVQVDGRRPGAQ